MKIGGFRYAMQHQLGERWANVMSGDDLATMEVLYDRASRVSTRSVRLIDQTTDDVLKHHVVFAKTEKSA